MAKSRRTCYDRNYKEFWTPRPLVAYCSNKENKVLCHRIERARSRALVIWELKQL